MAKHRVPKGHGARRIRHRALAALAVLSVVALGLSVGSPAQAAPGASRTYTSAVDFAEGIANNVVVEGDNVTMDDSTTAFPFMWIALSGRGTIARIDTLTGAVRGEYSTTSDGDGSHNPSRTTVGLDGSVWAGNRDQSSVIHVGLVEANQCVDRNSDGDIDTSTGYGTVLAWPGGSNGNSAPVSAAVDECILHYIDTAGSDARHVSVDGAGDVWVGNWTGSAGGVGGPHRFQKIDHATGTIVAGSSRDSACGGYGGLVDGNGVLWSASHTSLMRWDPAAPASPPQCITMTPGYNAEISVYGLAFDSQNNIWVSSLNSSYSVFKVNPAGTSVTRYYDGLRYSQGLAVDANDHVWMSSSLLSGYNSIAHLKPDGTLLGLVTTCSVGTAPGCRGIGSTGVAVDANGKIWTANYDSHNATRIDPNAGPLGSDGVTRVGAFDLLVSLPGSWPYNYSDMTGATLTGAPGSGTWTVVYDSAISGVEWGSVSWNATTPGDSGIAVTAASSSDGTTFGAAQPVTNAVDLTVGNGRYLKVTVLFTRSTADGDNDGTGDAPTLHDITIATVAANTPPSVAAGGPYTVAEGASTTVDGTGSNDADGDVLTHVWDLDDNGSFETAGALATFSAVGLDGPSSHSIGLRVCDPSNACSTESTTVSVTNVAPVAGPIAVPLAPVPLGSPVNASVTFSDAGSPDTHSALWSWGNGATTPGSATTASGASASHTYASPGVYQVTVTVTDDDLGADTVSAVDYVVVYDPNGAFVTGGGWIDSPASACRLTTACETAVGRANFGFMSKYTRGASVPSGNTEFQFHAGDLNFKSSSYDWLTVAGPKAQYKGSGTINGAGNYGFLLTANDGQVLGGGGTDRFRIKIWDRATGLAVYDNQGGTDTDPATQAIEGGSIVIHAKR